MKRLERFILFILEHLPILVTMLFSAYIVASSQIEKYSTETLLLWILSLLGLLATSILIERLGKLHRIEQFTQQMHEYLINRGASPSVDLLFSDRKSLPPLELRLQSAKEIMVTGGSLFRLTCEYIGFFEQKACDGCRLKFLLVNPNSEAANIVAKQIVYEAKDEHTYVNQIKISLDHLYHLKEQYQEQVEIRLYDSVPPFSLLLADPFKSHGIIQVELYTYAIPIRERPEFTLRSAHDPKAYKFFLSQFNIMWNSAKEYTP